MLTLNQMIGQIEEALNINSDDSNLSERYIIDLISQSRAFHLRNELNKFRTADDTVIQNLPCVELAVSDATLVPGLTLPTECRLLRSINRLPDTIELHHTDGIVSVGSVQFLEIPFKAPVNVKENLPNKGMLTLFMVNPFFSSFSVPGNLDVKIVAL